MSSPLLTAIHTKSTRLLATQSRTFRTPGPTPRHREVEACTSSLPDPSQATTPSGISSPLLRLPPNYPSQQPSKWPSEYVKPHCSQRNPRAGNPRPPQNPTTPQANQNPSFHAQRSAALKIDWTRIGTQLGLRGNTAASLMSFKKRNDEARRKLAQLNEQAQTVDFAYYRSTLKNTAVIDEIEKQFTAFQPKKYDVGRQIKAIETFEAQAVKSAEETKVKVDAELKDLAKTLKNIEEARPFEDLTVVCLCCCCCRVVQDAVARGFGRSDADLFLSLCRTRSLPLAPRLMSAPPSSFPRADGCPPDTRQEQPPYLWRFCFGNCARSFHLYSY